MKHRGGGGTGWFLADARGLCWRRYVLGTATLGNAYMQGCWQLQRAVRQWNGTPPPTPSTQPTHATHTHTRNRLYAPSTCGRENENRKSPCRRSDRITSIPSSLATGQGARGECGCRCWQLLSGRVRVVMEESSQSMMNANCWRRRSGSGGRIYPPQRTERNGDTG